MDVWPGAEAAAACLDAEQIAQHGDDEVPVEQPPRVADAQRYDREPVATRITEKLEVRVGSPGLERAPREVVLAPEDLVHAHLLLSANTSPAWIDSTIAGVPPSSRTAASGW